MIKRYPGVTAHPVFAGYPASEHERTAGWVLHLNGQWIPVVAERTYTTRGELDQVREHEYPAMPTATEAYDLVTYKHWQYVGCPDLVDA